ncbi:autophagy protein atg9 [Ranunculus cassubicifolius]
MHWSPRACQTPTSSSSGIRWMFREFNEVDHLFRHRINSSVPHACDYLKQFPSPVVTIIAKFISFVSGGFAAVLIIIAFLEESLLEGQMSELQVLDPEGAMSLVVQHTHFMPKRWRSKENTDTVRTEFETLFQYTGMMLLEEMVSIILTPYLLLLVVPKRVDDILQFISDFTVDVDGVGHVCSLSVFDFERHGNNKYASPHNASRTQRSSQGKLEKSFLSFQSTYPFWEPNADGKKFISNLRGFGAQKLQVRRDLQHPPNFMDQGRGYFTRDVRHDNNTRNYLLGSLWSYFWAEAEQEQGLDRMNSSRLLSSSMAEPSRDFWMDNNTTRQRDRGERSQYHSEASSSNPNLLEGHQTKSPHWWGRNDSNSIAPQTSFMEPPGYGGWRTTDSINIRDNSDRNSEEEEEQEQHQYMGRRNPPTLSKTFYMGDSGAGDDEFKLPFEDIHPIPPLKIRINNSDSMRSDW